MSCNERTNWYLLFNLSFGVSTAQINLINLGAALVTFSTALVVVMHYKKINGYFRDLCEYLTPINTDVI